MGKRKRLDGESVLDIFIALFIGEMQESLLVIVLPLSLNPVVLLILLNASDIGCWMMDIGGLWEALGGWELYVTIGFAAVMMLIVANMKLYLLWKDAKRQREDNLKSAAWNLITQYMDYRPDRLAHRDAVRSNFEVLYEKLKSYKLHPPTKRIYRDQDFYFELMPYFDAFFNFERIQAEAARLRKKYT